MAIRDFGLDGVRLAVGPINGNEGKDSYPYWSLYVKLRSSEDKIMLPNAILIMRKAR